MRSVRSMLLVVAAALLAFAPSARAGDNAFAKTVLVANRAEFNPTIMVDPHVVNAWGIALRPPGAGGHIWISNAHDGTTTTYIGDVNGVPLHQDGLRVTPIDQPAWTDHGYSQVTGQVYNAASDVVGQPVEFPVAGPASNLSVTPPAPIGTISGPAKFIFVTKEGTVAAWRSSTAQAMASAVIVKDYSITSQTPLGLPIAPVYTGVAITTDAFTVDGSGQHVAANRLYVTDFENDRIQVFDNQWNDITASGAFQHPQSVPPELHPFNIQYLSGRLFVAYAQLDPVGEDPGEEVDAPGAGHLVEFDRDGNFVADFPESWMLNAPWGMAIAPQGFGSFGGSLLVANFGDGTITAFDLSTHAFAGYLRAANAAPLWIDGIWGLTFGNGVSLGDANALYFTAGPNGEEDGMFGRVNAIALPTGVCCRGATCNASITPSECALSGTAGATYVLNATACASGPGAPACCAADFNKVAGVNVQDIFDFLTAWFAGSPFARVGGDGSPASPVVQDIFDFLSTWFAGCP